MVELKSIGLTDFYFKELIHQRKDYLLLLINGICNLNLSESEIEISDTEERDLCTLKTVNYDIKVITKDLRIDLEAQIKVNSDEKNLNGEYVYDISRAFYYLSVLHSRSYDYKEKGYQKRQSIVIFLYEYDIPGDDYIQKIGMVNYSTKVEYDDLLVYEVSLEKIPENSKIELERALKLLSRKDIEEYLDDKSMVIREAASMLSEYDRSERAQMLRDARAKDELEKATIKLVARKEGLAEGKAEGLAEGRKEGLQEGKALGKEEGIEEGKALGKEEGIEEGKTLGIEETKKNIAKSMYLKGMNKDTIASIIDVDIKDIDKYLE